MEVLTAIFSIMTAIIGLCEGLRTTYGWARKLVSDKVQKKLEKFMIYVRFVYQKAQEEVTSRMNLKCSKTSITADLEPLDAELIESVCILSKWSNKNRLLQRLASKKLIEELDKSENAICQRLREFSFYTQKYEEGNHALPQTQTKVKKMSHKMKRTEARRRKDRLPQKKKKFEEQDKDREAKKREDRLPQKKKEFEEQEEKDREAKKREDRLPQKKKKFEEQEEKDREAKKREDRLPQKKKEFEEQKESEVNEYKDWLKENIRKWTDSWSRYKAVSESATNSKLNLAEKEGLFRKHVNELREKYLREYRQLLKAVITPDLAIEYLTSWSDAERLLLRHRHRHRRFDRLPKEEREREWRNHADNILKKRKKEKKVHETK